jgi:hypothetical protein
MRQQAGNKVGSISYSRIDTNQEGLKLKQRPPTRHYGAEGSCQEIHRLGIGTLIVENQETHARYSTSSCIYDHHPRKLTKIHKSLSRPPYIHIHYIQSSISPGPSFRLINPRDPITQHVLNTILSAYTKRPCLHTSR